MSVTSWFLVSSSGTRHRLPPEMIFVGREECELMLQSRSVDKQHAVVNYDPATDEHMVKDLGSLNGTFVNDLRIPDQTYITLKLSDVIRFGYDCHVYILEKSQHKVPEEALKHEKYTSQLQMSMKALEARKREKERLHAEKTKDSSCSKPDKAEQKATVSTESPASRPTPLYGQPSWWGEEVAESNAGQRPEHDPAEISKDGSQGEVIAPLSDSKAKSIYHREPRYFEIPMKEAQSLELREVPTKDTDPLVAPPTTATPPVVQSHASFTIEFDECTPGKVKIKDHITKFSFRQQRKIPGREAVTTPTEVMSAESKVADWLVQSDVNIRGSRTEDMYDGESNTPIHTSDRDHEAQRDPEDPVVNGRQFVPSKPPKGPHLSVPPQLSPARPFTPPFSEEPLVSSPSSSSVQSPPQSQGKADLKQAFVIEFFDDNPRKKRSQSFNNTVQHDSPNLKKKLDSGPPTQQYTVPLKGPGSTGPQRAGSLRKEKTDDRMSAAYSSCSPVPPRPFRSVGRRSKLAQDFKAELARESRQESKRGMNITWERSSSESPTTSPPPAVMAAVPVSQQTPPSPTQTSVPYLVQTSSPVHQPVPMNASAVPTSPVTLKPPPSSEVGNPRGLKNEEDDTLSEAGTYTIEAEVLDKEVEEARSKIDQVFGVVEGPNQPSQTAPACHPVKTQDRAWLRENSSVDLKPAPGQGQSLVQGPGASKWVSRWASLADSYADSDPASCPAPQMELSEVGRRVGNQATHGQNINRSEPGGQNSRTRRILPQAPSMEKNEAPPPIILLHQDTYSTYDVRGRGSRAPRPQEELHNLSVKDDLDPDSLSESDDGSVVEQRKTPTPGGPDQSSTRSGEHDRPGLAAKSTSFYIGSDGTASKQEGGSSPDTPEAERKQQAPPAKTPQFSTATLTKQWGGQEAQKAVKLTSSAPNLDSQAKVSLQPKETSVPLVRQESFTKDHPSDAAQVTRLPHISSQPFLSHTDSAQAFQGVGTHETHSYLKETADALSALEVKLHGQLPDIAPHPGDDSLSGESDMDSASTASQRSSQFAPKTGYKKPSVTGGLQRERSIASSFSQEPSCQPSARHHLPERQGLQGSDSSSNAEPDRRLGMRRAVGKPGSMDHGDDRQNDAFSSDQERSQPSAQRKYAAPPQKDDSTKPPKVAQALSRSNSVTAPRPTRASMLRRARLGDASDSEAPELDRVSQNSQEASGTTKASQESKKQLSRLDVLALPRKRTSSFNTPSDTESSAPRTGFSNRSTESNSGSGRKASVAVPTTKPALGRPPNKPITRGHSSSLKYTSSTASSRRRQKGSDYTSTSEDEYDSSNQSNPKHKRSPSASRSQPLVPLRPKPSSRDSDQESHEGDAYQNWSTHSAEIARLSQDLAKDLAILAREINDVAGDDPHSSTVVEANTGPTSSRTAQEELVHSVHEIGVNKQMVPNSSAADTEPDQTLMNIQEHNSLHRGQNLEEDDVDGLMLTPISQTSLAIRENTEQLAEKIKVLFHNKADVWEELEAKINAENDIPVLKGSNKEITSILIELRRVQKQLEVINTIIEPGMHLQPAKATRTTPSSAVVKPSRTPSRDLRSSGSQRGGGGPPPSSRNSERVKRLAVSSEAESYVV